MRHPREFPAVGTQFLVHSSHAWHARIGTTITIEVDTRMRDEPELALTSTYHPCNQVASFLRGHVAGALTLLGSAKPSGSSIHAARQELKRARAALRLLRESIGAEHFRQEDEILRQAARQLNDVRDSEVVLRVFARLRDGLKDELRQVNLEPLHKLLLQEQRRAASAALDAPLGTARTLLGQAKVRSRDWSVKNDLDLLAKAMRRTYRKGRDCYRTACASATDENLHAWRRQVKYSAYQLETLGSLMPGRMRRRLRRCARLARMLGRDHDLLMLHQRISDTDLDAAVSLQLDRAIERERAKLQRRALELGKRLYRAKPRRFQPVS
jgi:CHAD domain-containing protein